MIKSGKSFSNYKVVALDPILKPVLNVKDIGLHFLTYFVDTSFYLLVIKSIYHQYSYQLTIEKKWNCTATYCLILLIQAGSSFISIINLLAFFKKFNCHLLSFAFLLFIEKLTNFSALKKTDPIQHFTENKQHYRRKETF